MKVKKLALAVQAGLFAAMAPAVAATTDATPDAGIERIIVTGQKIDRSLQETPTSVAVVTAQQLEDEQLYDFYDVLDSTVNVTGDFGSEFTIRGINSFNVSGGGNSFLTSVYLDGAPLSDRIIQQGGFSTWDVSQVEFLRGPQSTLQGRNALAGAVVVNTEKPTYEWSGKGRMITGEHGQQEAAVAFGGELIDNQVAFRFTAEDRSIDGFNSNPTRNQNSDFVESDFYRLQVLMEPEAIEGFSANLSISNYGIKTGVMWTQAGPDYGIDDRITLFNDPTFEKNDTDMISLDVNYELTDTWHLRSITTYTEAYWGYEWDGDQTAAPESILTTDRDDETLSQEFRFIYEGEKLRGVVGAYYSGLEFNQKTRGQRSLALAALGVPQLLTAPAEFGGLGLPQPMADAVMGLYANVDPVQLGQGDDLFNKVTNKAIFADFSYRLTDKIDLFGGFRWDRELQANSSESLYTIDNAAELPDPANPAFDPVTAQLVGALNAQLMGMAAAASGVKPYTERTFTEFLPKVGASYHWTEDLMTSFTYQKGYRSGGVGTNIAEAYSFSYDPEFTDNYELSFRSVWLDGDLVANANLFYLDWKDQQVNVQLSDSRYDRETRNAGSSSVKGLELEMQYFVNDELTISGGIGYAKSEFKEFIVDLPNTADPVDYDLSGESFAGAPEWTANLSATYKHESGFFGNLSANYMNSAKTWLEYWTLNDVQAYRGEDYRPRNDARTLVNARVGYEWENFSVYVIGKNLLDHEYYAEPDTGGVQIIGAPRQLSLTVEANF